MATATATATATAAGPTADKPCGFRGGTVVFRLPPRGAAGRPPAGRLVQFTKRASKAGEAAFAAAYTDADGKARVSYRIPTEPNADYV